MFGCKTVALITLIVLQTTIAATAQELTIEIPEPYRDLYSGIESCLDNLGKQIDSLPKPEGRKNPLIGAELLMANSNRGEDLLDDRALKGNIVYLNRLREMGVKGVTLQIGYPILLPDFPRYSEYLQFYKKLVAVIRSYNLVVHIKTGPSFTQPEFSKIKIDYNTIPQELYLAGRKHQALLILKHLEPDYLTIVNEPSTEKTLLGFEITKDVYRKFIQSVIEEAGSTKTLIGAGAGTWDDPSFIQAFSDIPELHFIDLHVYPVFGNCLDRAVSCSNLAIRKNKKLIIGEAWLYKTLGQEVSNKPEFWAQVFARDTYSFWQPLDQKFLAQLIKYARTQQVDYVSVFWSRYFFAYVPYNAETAAMTPLQLMNYGNIRAAANLLFRQLSSTGIVYKKLLMENTSQ